MTYIVGVLNQNVCYLAGDSVITSIRASTQDLSSVYVPEEKSSFGEHCVKVENRIIQESVVKVEEISDKLVFAFAGNAVEAFQVIQNLKDSLQIFSDPIGSIARFTNHNPGIELLVSIKNDKGDIQLFSYRKIQGKSIIKEYFENEVVQLGSLAANEWINKNTIDLISTILGLIYENHQTFTPKKIISMKLRLIVAYLQSLFYLDTMPAGVGGIYSGIAHTSEGVSRPPDTAYVLVEAESINEVTYQWIGAFYRKNITVINSPYLDRPLRELYTYIAPEFLNMRQEQAYKYFKNYANEVVKKINSLSYKSYMFMHLSKTGAIQILHIDNEDNRAENYFELVADRWFFYQEFLDKINELIEGQGEIFTAL